MGYQRANGSSLDSSGMIGCKATGSGTLSMPNVILTLVPLPAEEFDTNVMHSLVTNNDQVVCKTAGTFAISAGFRDTNTSWSTTDYGNLLLYKNGVEIAM